MNHIRLTETPISVDEASKLVTSPAAGAISLFVGTTRDSFDGRRVFQLQYEAYSPMAEREVQKICDQIRCRWNVVNICIFHRLGSVPLSEASVIIAISSVHRKESLEAVHYCIDALKASVPIWKKEIYEDGESSWKENCECKWRSGRQS
jgi:molybdopterin synthase catalytic subunit